MVAGIVSILAIRNVTLWQCQRVHYNSGCSITTYADVAELADAHDSGSCTRKGVEVQVLSSAP